MCIVSKNNNCVKRSSYYTYMFTCIYDIHTYTHLISTQVAADLADYKQAHSHTHNHLLDYKRALKSNVSEIALCTRQFERADFMSAQQQHEHEGELHLHAAISCSCRRLSLSFFLL